MNNIVDLYSGIGGATLGFLYAGYPAVYACETDPIARLVYLNNFLLTIRDDIRLAAASEIKHPEVVFAAPPSDPAAMSYMMRLIGEIKPRAVLLEFGIRQLKTDSIQLVHKAFSSLGYKSWHEALSPNDFGLAFRRKSLYFVAFRQDVKCFFHSFPFPDPTDTKAMLADVLDPEPADHLLIGKERLEKLLKENDRNMAAGTRFRHQVFEPNEIIPSLPICYYRDYRRILVSSPKGPRRLSVSECRKLMGFPDNFNLPVSNTQAYRLLARASCPPVIEALANEIDEWIRY